MMALVVMLAATLTMGGGKTNRQNKVRRRQDPERWRWSG